jgi:hypothetical protein
MNETLKVVLHNQYLMLDEIIKTINQDVLLKNPANGKWSVFENIAHLGRYNEMFYTRMQEVQHKNNPVIEPYVADKDLNFIEWCGKSFDLVYADFYSTRETLSKFFESLTEEQFKKTSVHSTYGDLTTEEWMQFFLLHEAHHLFTIFKLIHQK